MIAEVAFGVLLFALLVCSVAVVRSRNLVRSVFWLAATLIVTATVLVSMGATFLAGIQIVLYAGGVITLMLFGVMLTNRNADVTIGNPIHRPGAAFVAAAALFTIMLSSIWNTPELERLTPTHEVTAAQIGAMFLQEQLLAFEVLSILLLVAMIGAIVLSRRSDP